MIGSNRDRQRYVEYSHADAALRFSYLSPVRQPWCGRRLGWLPLRVASRVMTERRRVADVKVTRPIAFRHKVDRTRAARAVVVPPAEESRNGSAA
jgi:hypothetical protein